MIAFNFIDKELIALSGEETVDQSLGLMKKMGLTELPVLEGIFYKGMISETELLNAKDRDEIVANLPLKIFDSVEKQCHFLKSGRGLSKLI